MKLLSQNYVKYGLIMTAVMIVCLFLMEITGQNKTFEHSPFAAFFTFIAPLIVWFFGLRTKKKLQKGKLTYKQGVIEGFKMSLVFGIVSPFVALFYYQFVNPEIVAFVRETYQMKDATREMVIATDMLVQFLSSIIGGTVYAAIIAFFLKSKKK